MQRLLVHVSAAAATLAVLGAAVALAVRTPALVHRSPSRPTSATSLAPGRLCEAQRVAMGSAAFNQLWAGSSRGRNAEGICVSSMTKANAKGTASQLQQSLLSALRACKAIRRSSPASFRSKFGAGGKNALGACIRAHTNWS